MPKHVHAFVLRSVIHFSLDYLDQLWDTNFLPMLPQFVFYYIGCLYLLDFKILLLNFKMDLHHFTYHLSSLLVYQPGLYDLKMTIPKNK